MKIRLALVLALLLSLPGCAAWKRHAVEKAKKKAEANKFGHIRSTDESLPEDAPYTELHPTDRPVDFNEGMVRDVPAQYGPTGPIDSTAPGQVPSAH